MREAPFYSCTFNTLSKTDDISRDSYRDRACTVRVAINAERRDKSYQRVIRGPEGCHGVYPVPRPAAAPSA